MLTRKTNISQNRVSTPTTMSKTICNEPSIPYKYKKYQYALATSINKKPKKKCMINTWPIQPLTRYMLKLCHNNFIKILTLIYDS